MTSPHPSSLTATVPSSSHTYPQIQSAPSSLPSLHSDLFLAGPAMHNVNTYPLNPTQLNPSHLIISPPISHIPPGPLSSQLLRQGTHIKAANALSPIRTLTTEQRTLLSLPGVEYTCCACARCMRNVRRAAEGGAHFAVPLWYAVSSRWRRMMTDGKGKGAPNWITDHLRQRSRILCEELDDARLDHN